MKTNEFKKAYEAVSKELADHAAHGTIETLSCYYRTCLKTAEGLTENQRKIIEDAYNNAYEAIRTRLQKGGKEMSKQNTEETKAEVVKAEDVEVLDAKTVKAVDAAIDRVSKKMATITSGYLAIAGDVARLYDLEAWKVTGHKNIYELCNDKFEMARGTVQNLRNVFERFGDKDTYKLTDETEGRSLRSLLEQINAEKHAAIEDKNGEAGEGGEGKGGKSKAKAEQIVNISFDIIGGEWDVEAIAEELKKSLSKTDVDLTKDCTVSLIITR